jgi:hypothetical protein
MAADATEKILEKLIDSMHAKMAQGFGSKAVKPVAAIEEALEDAKEDKEENEMEEPKVPSIFEKWLQSENEKKVAPKKNQMIVSKTQITMAPKKKSDNKTPFVVGKK